MRDEPHDRAHREHAPCKPQRGDHQGCNRRKGRVTTGARGRAPPPSGGTSAAPRACAVLTTCLRNRADSEDAPPPPPPTPPPTDEKGDDSEETARGHGRGQGTKKKNKQQRTPTRQSDKSPRKTLVRCPTSGVWGPPRCPYRPHLSAGNKVGYAPDRWPAARGGTGLGGWTMGLTKSTPHGTYCGSCPVRGCG